MKQVNVRLTPELIKETKQIGLNEDLSFQAIVTEALESYIAIKLGNKQPQSINIESYNAINLESTITEENPTALFLLKETQKALHDHTTRVIKLYPETMDIEIDCSQIQNEVKFGNDYVLDPEEGYDQSLTRDDVDPLGMMSDEEVEIALEEARRLRG